MARRCRIQGCEKYAVRQGVCVSHGAKVHHARCTVPGCTKFAVRTGLCVSHGAKKPFCKVEGCERQAQQKGVCVAHGAKKAHCKTPGCVRQAVRGGMCKTHSPNDAETTCAYPTCTKAARKGAHCSIHRRTLQAKEQPRVSHYASGDYNGFCGVPLCRNPVLSKHLDRCHAHYYYGGHARLAHHDGGMDRGGGMAETYSICAVDGCQRFAKLQGKCIGHTLPLRRKAVA